MFNTVKPYFNFNFNFNFRYLNIRNIKEKEKIYKSKIKQIETKIRRF